MKQDAIEYLSYFHNFPVFQIDDMLSKAKEALDATLSSTVEETFSHFDPDDCEFSLKDHDLHPVKELHDRNCTLDEFQTNEFLTIREVARILRHGESTIRTMAERNEIPMFKVNSRWRIRKRELDKWISEKENQRGASDESLGKVSGKMVRTLSAQRTSQQIQNRRFQIGSDGKCKRTPQTSRNG